MASAELQALLTPDTAYFETVLNKFLSNDNAERQRAEEVFNELKQASPDATVTHLITVLRRAEATEYRTICAVILRRVRSCGTLTLISNPTLCRHNKGSSQFRCPAGPLAGRTNALVSDLACSSGMLSHVTNSYFYIHSRILEHLFAPCALLF
jgi:hypothetical protein